MPPAFKAVEKVMGSLLIGNLSLLPLPTWRFGCDNGQG